jgi:SWI/SNF-related matrix-associated actin-dependent regulator of chromatin subfamily A3
MLEPMLVWATPRQSGFPQRARGGVPGTSSASAMAALSAAGGVYPSTYSAALAASMGMPGPSQARGMTSAQSEAQQEAIRKQHEAFVRAAELKQMLSGLERVDDEDRRASLLDTLCSTVDILNLPVHPNPPGVANGELVVDLLKHQVRLSFCSRSYTMTRA